MWIAKREQCIKPDEIVYSKLITYIFRQTFPLAKSNPRGGKVQDN